MFIQPHSDFPARLANDIYINMKARTAPANNSEGAKPRCSLSIASRRLLEAILHRIISLNSMLPELLSNPVELVEFANQNIRLSIRRKGSDAMKLQFDSSSSISSLGVVYRSAKAVICRNNHICSTAGINNIQAGMCY